MKFIPEICPICSFYWGHHSGPEFCAHLLRTLDSLLEAKFKEAMK